MTVKHFFETKLSQVFGAYAENICFYYFSYHKKISAKDSIEQLKLDGIFFLAQYDLNRLLAGVPVQYVISFIEVLGYEFETSPEALIPRPETEELIQLIHELHLHANSQKVLDIGTGSGIIPISLKKKHADWELVGIDISTKALSLATKNARNLKVDIRFLNEDIFNFNSTETYDIIISNPPYIPKRECLLLEDSVRNFEPTLALEVPDDNPLIFYKAIINYAVKHLTKNGSLYFEIHQNFGEELLEEVKPFFQNCILRKDFAKNNRFILASVLQDNIN